jgi:hypothetical protein
MCCYVIMMLVVMSTEKKWKALSQGNLISILNNQIT